MHRGYTTSQHPSSRRVTCTCILHSYLCFTKEVEFIIKMKYLYLTTLCDMPNSLRSIISRLTLALSGKIYSLSVDVSASVYISALNQRLIVRLLSSLVKKVPTTKRYVRRVLLLLSVIRHSYWRANKNFHNIYHALI